MDLGNVFPSPFRFTTCPAHQIFYAYGTGLNIAICPVRDKIFIEIKPYDLCPVRDRIFVEGI
jgi:hypothetical protein